MAPPQPSPPHSQVSPLRSMSQSLSRVAPLPISNHEIHLTSRDSQSTLHNNTMMATPSNAAATTQSPHHQQVELQSLRQRPVSASTQPINTAEMYHQPLLHYKYVTDRTNSSRPNVLQSLDDDVDEKTPLQVLLPGSDSRQMVLATSDVKLFKQLVGPAPQQTAANNRSSITQQQRGGARPNSSATEFLLYFNHHINRTLASPLAHKYNIYVALTLVFVVIDAILISVLYFLPSVFDSNLSKDYSGNTLIMYITCLICLVSVVFSVCLRDIRLMYLLCVVYYSLSLIQLLRIYSVVQFSHFVMQLAVCHALRQVRVTLTPIWTEPLR